MASRRLSVVKARFRSVGLFLTFALAACKGSDASNVVDAAPSASASAAPQVADVDTHGKWWAVAQKSKVFTQERRVDADNGIRMLPAAKRDRVRRTLDDMATQTADGDGITAASQIARDGQDAVDDAHNPAPSAAIRTAGFIVLHGLIAQACADHKDTASLAPVIAAIHEMPLPHLEKGNGIPERLVLEQEMRMGVDDKTMKALLAGAPASKKSPQ